MQPDYRYLTKKIGVNYPLIGFYDSPYPKPFEPYIEASTCVFSYYKLLAEGISIVLTRKQYGCAGAGNWLCNIETKSKEEYVSFLTDYEGLKANHSLTKGWLEYEKPYQQEHDNLIIGILKKSEYKYLKTITFYVNPDQLSMLMIGAQFFSSPSSPEPVIAPFGSGCMQLVPLFKNLNIPQAIIGATDLAMRKHLPPSILAFTVTKPMFELLCKIYKKSYFEKPYYKSLIKIRNKNT